MHGYGFCKDIYIIYIFPILMYPFSWIISLCEENSLNWFLVDELYYRPAVWESKGCNFQTSQLLGGY